MRAIIFLSMPQTSAGLADRHSPGIAVCLRAALSQSQGTSFVMFRTLQFCCSVCKGQRFHKTHTACEGGQEGWSQHCVVIFFLRNCAAGSLLPMPITGKVSDRLLQWSC